LIKKIGENVELHYLRTKKIAVVSQRDQYVISTNTIINAEDSETK